ncbi:MAG: hypothetical protein IPJ41_12415 [Phycisphaerales bacterium]|nr:hypothetical protein [Phycisphaerales bacterium]
MSPITEPIVIVVGFGTGAFLLAVTRILGSAASRRIDAHMVQVKAMELRNDYMRQLQAVAPTAGKVAGRGAPELTGRRAA